MPRNTGTDLECVTSYLAAIWELSFQLFANGNHHQLAPVSEPIYLLPVFARDSIEAMKTNIFFSELSHKLIILARTHALKTYEMSDRRQNGSQALVQLQIIFLFLMQC